VEVVVVVEVVVAVDVVDPFPASVVSEIVELFVSPRVVLLACDGDCCDAEVLALFATSDWEK
jgi:hypothetical protein